MSLTWRAELWRTIEYMVLLLKFHSAGNQAFTLLLLPERQMFPEKYSFSSRQFWRNIADAFILETRVTECIFLKLKNEGRKYL